MTTQDYLKTISKSKKPFIIYKSDKGFDLYTNFSKKIILTNKNIHNFINKISKNKLKNKSTDLFIGFFGYEILNNLIGVKIPRQKGIKFPKGIFYKPKTKIKLLSELIYKPIKNNRSNKFFKINLNKDTYEKIFNRFKKKLNQAKLTK